MSPMSSNKPYLIRAFYEWILDNECTPYLVAWTDHPGIDVPMEFASDGQITLNLSPSATPDLEINNDWISFSARFSGVARQLFIPMDAVQAVLAKENGQGMAFEKPEYSAEPVVSEKVTKKEEDRRSSASGRPGLKVVK